MYCWTARSESESESDTASGLLLPLPSESESESCEYLTTWLSGDDDREDVGLPRSALAWSDTMLPVKVWTG